MSISLLSDSAFGSAVEGEWGGEGRVGECCLSRAVYVLQQS
jgi:hypothetical protein